MSLLNRYEILAPLGRGGMGAVYRARDRLTGQEVALKRVQLAPEQLLFNSRTDATTPTLALAAEFQTLASLRHPHIISVLDYGFDVDKQPFFTMTLLRDPQTILQAGVSLDTAGKVRLLVQMLQALAYLHRRGILHRDLKPANVMAVDQEVKVLDFGLSAEASTSTATAGTLAYMAPELLRGQPASVASDLFAAGVIAYEMFSGAHPFQADTVSRLIDQILYQSVDPLVAGIDTQLAYVIERLLDKEPTVRYPDARAVIKALSAAIGEPLPVETAATRESFLQAAQFIGRETELGALSEALQEAGGGRGSVWLIGGESGVGKSRLLDELQTRALVAGILTLRAGTAADGGLLYHLWRQIAPSLVLTVELTDLEAGVLKTLVPDIGTLIGREIPDAPSLSAKTAGQRLANVLTDLFRRQTGTTLLILEDLHWAGESLEPLKLLVTQVAGLKLLIVGSYRDDEAPTLPESLPEARTLELERLKPEEVAALGEAILGEAGRRSQVVELLQTETEGNAFFVVEVVRALAEEAGHLDNIGAITLPESVFAGGMRRIIQRRLDRVPAYGRRLLTLAALAGRVLDLPVLAHANRTASLINQPLDIWLAECAEAAVLEVREGGWRFAHDKLREGAQAAVPEADRPALHRQLAEAIEAVYAERLESWAEALVFHWQGAGDSAKEAHYAEIAGHYLFRTGASAQALSYFTRAVRLHADPPPSLHIAVARAHSSVGHFQEAADGLRAVYERAQATQDQQTLADAAEHLANTLTNMGQYDGAEQYAREALSRYQMLGDADGVADAQQTLGGVFIDRGKSAEALPFLQEALRAFQTLGKTRARSSVLLDLCRVASDAGDFETASRHAEEGLTLAREVDDRSQVARALVELGVINGRRGDHARSRDYYREAYEINRLLGLKSSMAVARLNQGIATKNLGEYEAAKALYEEARQVFQASRFRMGETVSAVNIGNVLEKLNRDAEAMESLREGLRIATEIGANGIMAAVLVDVSRLLLKGGEAARAAEYALLAMKHPSLVTNNRKDAESILEQARAALLPDDFAAAERRAESRSPDDAMADIRAGGTSRDHASGSVTISS